MTIPVEIMTRAACLGVARTWPEPMPEDSLSPDAMVLWDSIMEHLPKRKKKLPEIFRVSGADLTEQPILPVVHRWILWDLLCAIFEQNYSDQPLWVACRDWYTDPDAKTLLMETHNTPFGYIKPCLNPEPRNKRIGEVGGRAMYYYPEHTFYDDLGACWDRAHMGARPGRELNPPEHQTDFMLRVRLYRRLGRVLPDTVPDLPPPIPFVFKTEAESRQPWFLLPLGDRGNR